jgi:hypothetical protein
MGHLLNRWVENVYGLGYYRGFENVVGRKHASLKGSGLILLASRNMGCKSGGLKTRRLSVGNPPLRIKDDKIIRILSPVCFRSD